MSNYIPATHQTVQQLQNTQGVISSASPQTYTNTVYSSEVVKPSTVYTYTTGNGQVVQLNKKSNIQPTTNIYSSFDPNQNLNSVFVTYSSRGQSQQQSPNRGVYEVQGVPQYQAYQSVENTNSNLDEGVKRSNNNKGGKKSGRNSSSSSSSDDDNGKKVVTQLKFNKNTIEQLNNKLSSKDAHITQLIKATDLKDQQIQKLNVEINQIRISGGSSSNVENSQEYQFLQQEFLSMRSRCEELESDNQQLALLVQTKDEEKSEILSQLVLLKSQIEALHSKQTVVVQSSYSPELEIWKNKCADLERELNNYRINVSQQSNYQVEMLNVQLKERNSEIERLKQQIASIQKNSEMLVSLEMENSSLKQQIQSLNLKITSLTIQINQGNSSQQGINILEQKIKDYQVHNQRLEEQVQQLSSYKLKFEMLEHQFNACNAELRKKEQEVQELRSEVELIKRALREREQQINQLESQTGNEIRLREVEIQELRQRITNYETQIQRLEGQININVSAYGETESIKRSLREKEEQLRQLDSQRSNELRQREQENQELIQELQKRQLEISELRQRMSSYEAELSSGQQSKIEIESLRRALREYEEKIRILENQKFNAPQNDQQFEQFNIEIYNLSQQLKIQNQDANDLRSRCENLQRQLSESEARFSSLQSRFNESEQSNRVIIGENSTLIQRLKELEFQFTQISGYENQINSMREGYFNILAQFVLVSSVLESQSGQKSTTTVNVNYSEVNDLQIQISQFQERIRQLEYIQNSSQQQSSELYNLQSEIKILRQDNIDLATRCKNFQSNLEAKDFEIARLIAQFNQIEQNNKVIISENDKLIISLREKDTQIARLQAMEQNSTQITTLTFEINEWKSKFEQSRQDILIICQESERLKAMVGEKDREINQLRANQSGYLARINELTYLEGEMSRMRIQLSQKDEEIYSLKRTDRISTPDNNHQLILQITSKEQELEETKKRFSIYVEKNAELQAEVDMLKTRRQGGDDMSSITSNADKDQLIHRYRVENKRLQSELQDLQNFVRLNQNELRQLKGNKGCGYGCA